MIVMFVNVIKKLTKIYLNYKLLIICKRLYLHEDSVKKVCN